jgi:hypothetical protein
MDVLAHPAARIEEGVAALRGDLAAGFDRDATILAYVVNDRTADAGGGR